MLKFAGQLDHYVSIHGWTIPLPGPVKNWSSMDVEAVGVLLGIATWFIKLIIDGNLKHF